MLTSPYPQKEKLVSSQVNKKNQKKKNNKYI